MGGGKTSQRSGQNGSHNIDVVKHMTSLLQKFSTNTLISIRNNCSDRKNLEAVRMPLCPVMKITAFVPGLDFGLPLDAIIVVSNWLA